MILLIKESKKDTLVPEFPRPWRNTVRHRFLEIVVRVEALPFQMFFQRTKHMATAGRMIKLLPLELGQFHANQEMCGCAFSWNKTTPYMAMNSGRFKTNFHKSNNASLLLSR
ncbi:hypothetical protein TNCV_2251741 [Trichonephila clavipes]|nr:hypothetical protein TNCV_2251741 [Trichonephila clavipes]